MCFLAKKKVRTWLQDGDLSGGELFGLVRAYLDYASFPDDLPTVRTPIAVLKTRTLAARRVGRI